ncbi:MAG TPA: queuosine precursor transporter [Bryobacteraceae bacterium]|nr:queuosine precursor transporter [Bryobacteraceae bacterium]
MAEKTRVFKYYDLLASIFIVVLVISNLVGQKICDIGGYPVSGAQLLFPITYIFGDVFTEVYGYGGSRRIIWIGFAANALMAGLGNLIVALPAAPGWKNQEAFAIVFHQVPRLVLASLIAYWCGEFANSFTLAKMKLITKGRFLWTRTVGSTVVGQAVDTLILSIIAFTGEVPRAELIKLIIAAYFFKVAYEVIATPLTYAIVGFLKHTEGIDTFDYETRFTPFATEI